MAELPRPQAVADNGDRLCSRAIVVGREGIEKKNLAKLEQFRDQANAADVLAKKIRRGGTGVWGQDVMPPQPKLPFTFFSRMERRTRQLGIGVPITDPSLGLMIANGQQSLLAGQYWMSVYPGLLLLATLPALALGLARGSEPVTAAPRCSRPTPPASSAKARSSRRSTRMWW